MTVTERPRLILPGLVPADPRLERYRVRPGAVTAVELGPGDEITVIDPDGRQRGELTVLRPGGGGFAALGATADGPATVLRALATDSMNEGTVGRVLAELAARGLDPAGATAVTLFGEWSPPGTQASFTAAEPVTCVIAAPGGLQQRRFEGRGVQGDHREQRKGEEGHLRPDLAHRLTAPQVHEVPVSPQGTGALHGGHSREGATTGRDLSTGGRRLTA